MIPPRSTRIGGADVQEMLVRLDARLIGDRGWEATAPWIFLLSHNDKNETRPWTVIRFAPAPPRDLVAKMAGGCAADIDQSIRARSRTVSHRIGAKRGRLVGVLTVLDGLRENCQHEGLQCRAVHATMFDGSEHALIRTRGVDGQPDDVLNLNERQEGNYPMFLRLLAEVLV